MHWYITEGRDLFSPEFSPRGGEDGKKKENITAL